MPRRDALRTRMVRLRALLADQGSQIASALRGIRPARGLKVLVGVLVALGVVVLAGLVPLFVQRALTLASTDEELVIAFFTAWMLTLLAQATLIYIITLLLAYATAELFSPRKGVRLSGPRATIWESLHRLGNATSITLVLTVAGTAVGIALFGPALHERGVADSPAELAGIQLGTLLFILTLALLYESVRVTVHMLDHLPAVWRWASALAYPWLASLLVYLAIPSIDMLHRIFDQWVPDGAEDDVDLTLVGDLWDPLISVVIFAVLGSIFFVTSGSRRRLSAALREDARPATPTGTSSTSTGTSSTPTETPAPPTGTTEP